MIASPNSGIRLGLTSIEVRDGTSLYSANHVLHLTLTNNSLVVKARIEPLFCKLGQAEKRPRSLCRPELTKPLFKFARLFVFFLCLCRLVLELIVVGQIEMCL